VSEDENPLARAIGEALQQLLEKGFEWPLHAAAVGVNGSAIVLRYNADGEGPRVQCLAEYEPPNAMMDLPINIMISDARGEAARIVIGPDGKSRMVH
jgi:hypothetical protein